VFALTFIERGFLTASFPAGVATVPVRPFPPISSSSGCHCYATVHYHGLVCKLFKLEGMRQATKSVSSAAPRTLDEVRGNLSNLHANPTLHASTRQITSTAFQYAVSDNLKHTYWWLLTLVGCQSREISMQDVTSQLQLR
jgi:hypothetical protein